MALYVDSPWVEEVEQAVGWGVIEGVTTNPALLANVETPNNKTLLGLSRALQRKGLVFYQPTADTNEARLQQIHAMNREVGMGLLGVKLPCNPAHLKLAKSLLESNYTVGMTAVFSPGQVALACAAGAQYVLPYVNRSTRLLGDGPELIRQMRTVIDSMGSQTQIIAASIKSPEEAYDTLAAGAHHLTLPFNVLKEMAQHPLTEQAIEDFAKAAKKE